MIERPFFVHALSPLHVGSGQSTGHIDLPVTRMKATGIPFVPGTGMKGVLRDRLAPASHDDTAAVARHRAIFGPDLDKQEDPSEHAGAVVFGDARLFALPVRSLYGTFAWVSSPLLLRLARRDISVPGAPAAPTVPAVGHAVVTKDSVLLARDRNKLFLEDLDLKIDGREAEVWAEWTAKWLFSGDEGYLTQRFVIVDDETMTFLWETATQVDARVKLTAQGTVKDGALWYEESLPAETLLLGLAAADRSRSPECKEGALALMDACLGEVLAGVQLGGKASVGRGRVRIVPVLTAGAEG